MQLHHTAVCRGHWSAADTCCIDIYPGALCVCVLYVLKTRGAIASPNHKNNKNLKNACSAPREPNAQANRGSPPPPRARARCPRRGPSFDAPCLDAPSCAHFGDVRSHALGPAIAKTVADTTHRHRTRIGTCRGNVDSHVRRQQRARLFHTPTALPSRPGHRRAAARAAWPWRPPTPPGTHTPRPCGWSCSTRLPNTCSQRHRRRCRVGRR